MEGLAVRSGNLNDGHLKYERNVHIVITTCSDRDSVNLVAGYL